jgi:hypothetical protein
MVRKSPVSPSQRVYMDRLLTDVEARRSQPVGEADIRRLLNEMRSPAWRPSANGCKSGKQIMRLTLN